MNMQSNVPLDNSKIDETLSPDPFNDHVDKKYSPRYQFNPRLLVVTVLIALAGTTGTFIIRNKQRNSQNTSYEKSTQNQPSVVIFTSPTSPKALQHPLPYKILFTEHSTLYRTDGINDEKLVEFNKDILSIAANNDGSSIAIIYRSEGQSGMFTYYPGKLVLYYPELKKTVPLFTASGHSLTYPQWSPDGRYLSVWLDSGAESFVYDVSKQQPIFSIKKSDNDPVSPIMFINTKRIVYIAGRNLYEANVDGTNAFSLAKNVSSTRLVHEGPSLPNVPLYSPNKTLIAYFGTNGDLIVLDKTTGSSSIVVPGAKSEMFNDFAPQAYPIGFIDNAQILYFSESYSVGQPSPLYVYHIGMRSSKRFTESGGVLTKGVADLSSTIIGPDNQTIAVHSVITNQGLDAYNTDGTIKYECGNTNFRYSFYNWGGGPNYAAVLNVWSPDGKFILSEGPALSVMDITTCEVATVSARPHNLQTWIAQ